ncbi:choline/ethanolaminephosphotransferase 1-like [Diadema antillarum]|uniref:choline/ethanolaminephosphotransferase 1-like n=1 Tax=Diadema antillarum TaxID=105358 RepID=UPI003A8A06CE
MALIEEVVLERFFTFPLHQAPLIGVELRYLILGFGVITFLSCTVSTLHEIYTAQQPTSKATKTGPIVADSRKLPPIYPMVALVGLTVLLWVSPGSESIYQQPCVFMLIIGTAAAKIATKIITMHIVKAEMTFTNSAYLGLLVLLVNSVLGSPLDTLVLCPIVLVVSFLDYMRYFCLVAWQVAEENGVYILTSPDKKTLWANGTAVEGALGNGVAENDCHGNGSNHH